MKGRIILTNSDEIIHSLYKSLPKGQSVEVDVSENLSDIGYLSQAKSMQQIYETILNLRQSTEGNSETLPVLIYGEPGTGKERIARMIHKGPDSVGRPYIKVRCADFSDQNLESILFGAGSRQGLVDIAQGGTLLLNGVADLTLSSQAALMELIHKNTDQLNIRIVATSTVNLEQRVRQEKFRADLCQYFSKVVLHIPTLRSRSDDIVPMACQFAERFFRTHGKVFRGFSEEAEVALKSFNWPGNVSELLNVVERLALVCHKEAPISEEELSQMNVAISKGSHAPVSLAHQPEGATVHSMMDAEASYTQLKKRWCDAFERDYLISILNRNSGNVSAAAREAKLDRSNFLRLLRRHGLKAQFYRRAA